MNRRQRRHWRAKADELARRAATAPVLSRGERDGDIVRIDDPIALGVLQREWARVLRGGGRPVTCRLDPGEAAAFPHLRQSPGGGVEGWLAAGVDVSGALSFSVRWLPADEAESPEWQAALLVELRRAWRDRVSIPAGRLAVPREGGDQSWQGRRVETRCPLNHGFFSGIWVL